MTTMRIQSFNTIRRTSEEPEDQGSLALAKVLSEFGSNDERADLALSFETKGFQNFAPIGSGLAARYSTFAFEFQPSSSPTNDVVGSQGQAERSVASGSATNSALTIANGATVEIDGPSAQSVTFAGATGTLKLEDPQAFTGLVSGLTGADAIDLSGFAYDGSVKASYLGDAAGGTLTVTDGAKTAHIALSGNYLSSTWTLSSDGKGGTTVVDPTTSANWQTLSVGAGGFVRGLDIAPDGTMVGRPSQHRLLRRVLGHLIQFAAAGFQSRPRPPVEPFGRGFVVGGAGLSAVRFPPPSLDGHLQIALQFFQEACPAPSRDRPLPDIGFGWASPL